MRVLRTYRCTISDGPGLRYSIYLAGCRHHCLGCHNPLSWDATQGTELTPLVLQTILQQIADDPLLDGITISGGDPFYDPAELRQLLQAIRSSTSLPIWVYTGYTMEQLVADPQLASVLPYIDTIVDGRFERSLFDPHLEWRGSSNQRIISVAEWMSAHATLESEESSSPET